MCLKQFKSQNTQFAFDMYFNINADTQTDVTVIQIINIRV